MGQMKPLLTPTPYFFHRPSWPVFLLFRLFFTSVAAFLTLHMNITCPKKHPSPSPLLYNFLHSATRYSDHDQRPVLKYSQFTTQTKFKIYKGEFTHSVPCPYRAHAAPLPCSNSAVSFVKVRVVAGNIRTASPTV
jgi:hypothetical protein